MSKRFIYDGLHIRDLHGKIPPILTNNDKIRDKYLNELNELHKENQQLRKSLKRELMAMSGSLCDACKHEEIDNTNNWLVGIDFDVKCRKGHEILLDDEEQECEDFELRLEDLE